MDRALELGAEFSIAVAVPRRYFLFNFPESRVIETPTVTLHRSTSIENRGDDEPLRAYRSPKARARVHSSPFVEAGFIASNQAPSREKWYFLSPSVRRHSGIVISLSLLHVVKPIQEVSNTSQCSRNANWQKLAWVSRNCYLALLRQGGIVD